MKELYWKMILNTNDKRKAEILTATILKVLGNGKCVLFQQYWKDRNCFEVEFTEKINSNINSVQIFEVIRNIQRLSNSWQIDTIVRANDEYEFSGVASAGLKVTGVIWCSFIVQEVDSHLTIV